MSFLSAAELSAIRDDVANLLPDTCNILQVTYSPDGQGGMSEAWGTATASVACRRDPITGKEVVIGGRVQAFHGYVFTLPHDTTVVASNRLEHGSDTFAVVSVDDGKSWQASLRVYAEIE